MRGVGSVLALGNWVWAAGIAGAAGLGRAVFGFGPLLGVAALAAARGSRTASRAG